MRRFYFFKKATSLLFIIILSHYFLNAQNVNSGCDDSELLGKLLKTNLKKYTEKPVNSLLLDIRCNPQTISFVQMKPSTIGWGRVYYTKEIWIDIYIDNFKIMKKELKDGESSDVWKEEDFRNETITKIRIGKNRMTLKQYPKNPVMPDI